MKIWHLNSNRWNSAITEYSISSARALQALGHECIYTSRSESPADQRAKKYLDTLPFPSFSVKASPAFMNVADGIEPDIIICYEGLETTLARFYRKARKVRFFGRDRDFKRSSFSQFSKWLSFGHVDKFIVPSFTMKKNWSESLKIVDFIPLGIDTTRFYPKAPQVSDRPTLLLFGRFDPVKGHMEFLDLFAQLQKSWSEEAMGPRPLLRILGKEKNIGVRDLLTKMGSLGLRDHVVVEEGDIADPAAEMCAASLGVVPSVGSEVIGRVTQEFLCCGTPVLVSGVGALDELMFPGAGGTFSNLSDADKLKLLLSLTTASFAENREQRLERASKAHETYSLSAMGASLERSLNPLLAKKPGRL